MPHFMLIYDLYDGQNYGLYDRESGERVAGIVVAQDATGEFYTGQGFNIPSLPSKPFESLDDFAERLFHLWSAVRERWMERDKEQSLGLFD